MSRHGERVGYVRHRMRALCHPDRIRVNGRGDCRSCHERAKRDGALPPISRIHRLKKLGLTLNDYEAQLIAQGRVCAICRQPCKSGHALSIDHDHATNRFRGLLCVKCNTKLGRCQDDAARWPDAADYLAGKLLVISA